MRRQAFSLLFTLVLSVVVSAQSPSTQTNPTVKAADVLGRARTLYAEEGPKAALPEFEKALKLFRDEKNRLGEAITLGLIGNCYRRLGEYPKALDYLQRALAGKREVGDRIEEGKTLSHLGLLFWEMGEYPRAVEHYTKAIDTGRELKDRVLEASSRNNLGLIFDELGEYRKSLAEYNRALELYKLAQTELASSNATIERGMSDTVGNIGGVSLLLGDYPQALLHYQQALAMDERGNRKPGMSLDLQNIGLSYIGLGRFPEALESFDRSIKLASDAGLGKEEVDSRKGKGSALLQLGKYTQAREEYRHALRVYEKAGLKQQLVEGLNDLGELDFRLGDDVSAEQSFRRALEIAREIKHPRGVTMNLIALGNLEWRRKRYSEAAAIYRDALARADEVNDRATATSARISLALTLLRLKLSGDASREAQQAAEIAAAIQAKPLEAEAHYALGEIEREGARYDEAIKHFTSAQRITSNTGIAETSWRTDFSRGQALEGLNRFEDAVTAYKSAIRTIEMVRSELREERFRAGYIQDKYQVYVALVQLLLKLGRAETAFDYAERLRARSYLDLFSRGQTPIRNKELRERESTLKNRIRKLQENLDNENAKTSPDQRRQVFELFSKELAEAERAFQNLIDDLRNTEPAYVSARALQAPTVNEIKLQLGPRTALIEYVLAERSLTVFVVRADGLRAMTVPINSADLRLRVELLRSLMSRKQTNEWRLPGQKLHDILVGPVEDAGWLRGIDRLYLVPHDVLHYVPFAALPGKSRPTKLLIENYALAYLPAAAALIHKSNASKTSNSMLAMAPSSTRLQYTQQESRSVAEFFGSQNTVLLGNRATESSFKNLAGNFDVIHMATHGYFNKMNPLLSGVMLESDSTEDGRLEVHEILGMRLQAQLVTLSACDTALGSGYFSEIPAGDEIVGLTRAFLFAGTPSVVATLWEVNDHSSVELMRGFYGAVARSRKAAALANAQRKMLRGRGLYRHPYFWAPFVLVGSMD